MGPRLTLELIKIEEGLNDGEVLYHKYGKILFLLGIRNAVRNM